MAAVITLGEWAGAPGWMRPGAVPASQMGGGSFWARAGRVAAVGAGARLDAVHTFGLLTAAATGASAQGTLPALLAALPREAVARHLGPVSREAGLGILDGRWSVGLAPATPGDIAAGFGAMDGASWHEAARGRAFRWVEALGALLADPATYRAHGEFAGGLLKGRLPGGLREALGWPPHAEPGDDRRQRVGALALSLAGVSPRATVQLVRAAGSDVDAMLDVIASGPTWPSEFRARAGRLRAAIAAERWG